MPTEAGARLAERLRPAFNEIDECLAAVLETSGEPAGNLSLNVPVSAARLILPIDHIGASKAFPS